jgi:hypothetical protein
MITPIHGAIQTTTPTAIAASSASQMALPYMNCAIATPRIAEASAARAAIRRRCDRSPSLTP